MLHVTESQLRRLDDEPLAVPDRVVEHLERCTRCQQQMTRVVDDAERCRRAFSGPRPVADVDSAWARLRRTFDQASEGRAGSRPFSIPRRQPRLARVSLRTALVAGAVAAVVCGTTAAATLTTVFAPTRVAPLTLGGSDVGALASFMGLGSHLGTANGSVRRVLGGFSGTSGTLTTSFGTVRWSSSSPAHTVAALAEAVREAGFAVILPSKLPNGVAGPRQFLVQPRVQVTVTFNSSVPNVGGSSVVLDAGPAVLVAYGSAAGPDLPTLGVLIMPRPVAVSSGATMSQIETYVLGRRGLPPELVQEIRLLGNLGTTLPVPVPRGAVERSVEIAGSPGVLVAEPADVASAVVWEDGAGMLHVVAGLVDQRDVLDVAGQLG